MTIKNTDLETLYSKIEKRMDLIGAHLSDVEILPMIMKSCRLKPYSIFSNDYQSRTVYEPHWVDEFGNSLKIMNKSCKIILNDVQINKNAKISTDLFFGNSIDSIAKNSECVLLITGKINAPCYLAAFYGKDKFLRCFFYNKKTIRISPLILGMNTLHGFFINIRSVLKKDINKDQMDLLIKLDELKYKICWEPTEWKNYIKGDCT